MKLFPLMAALGLTFLLSSAHGIEAQNSLQNVVPNLKNQQLTHGDVVNIEKAFNQKDSLDALVAIAAELQNANFHQAEPCLYSEVVLGVTAQWGREMLSVPADAKLTKAEAFGLNQSIIAAATVVSDARSVAITSACAAKDNDKCCDASDPLAQSCPENEDTYCKLTAHGACNINSDDCPAEE